MSRTASLVLVFMAGCARPSSDQTPLPELPEALAVVEKATITAAASQNTESFDIASDLGGYVVARAVALDTPALAPIERFAVAPRPRIAPVNLIDPDSLPKVILIRRPFPPPVSSTVRLDPPAERVPPDLGSGAGAVPTKPKLPFAAQPTKRSRDVNLPPPLPSLARQVADRVGFEDPTTEFGNTVVTDPRVSATFSPAPFLKVGVPDPFELAEQIKPTIPRTAEPGLTPVIVNPRRVK